MIIELSDDEIYEAEDLKCELPLLEDTNKIQENLKKVSDPKYLNLSDYSDSLNHSFVEN